MKKSLYPGQSVVRRYSRPLKKLVKRTLISKPLKLAHSLVEENSCNCLMYHRITDRPQASVIREPAFNLNVDLKSFNEQIKYLAKTHNCLSVTQVRDCLASGSFPRNAVHITFDDGYKDNLELALPVLERYQVPATIFVCSGLVDGQTRLWWHELEYLLSSRSVIEFKYNGQSFQLRTDSKKWLFESYDCLNQLFKSINPQEQALILEQLYKPGETRYSYAEQMLSWDQVRSLANHPLITIGAHTSKHSVLSVLSDEDLRHEILDSKLRLEEELQQEVKFFSYPYGEPEHAFLREYELTRELGFSLAFTTCPGRVIPVMRAQTTALPRVSIVYSDNRSDFLWKTSSFYNFSQKYRRPSESTHVISRTPL